MRDDVGAWVFVHTVFLFFTPLLGIATYLLLSGLESGAASVSRVALIFFLVFYTAYEVTVGAGTGILVDYANGLPAGDQAVVADAIQDLNRNAILSDPSVSFVLGGLGWIVAMIAAAVAFRHAGADWLVTILVGFAALFAVHPHDHGRDARRSARRLPASVRAHRRAGHLQRGRVIKRLLAVLTRPTLDIVPASSPQPPVPPPPPPPAPVPPPRSRLARHRRCA